LEVGVERQVEARNGDQEGGVEDLLRLGPQEALGQRDRSDDGEDPDRQVDDEDDGKAKRAGQLDTLSR